MTVSERLKKNILHGIAYGCIAFVLLGIRHELRCTQEVCTFVDDFTARAVGTVLVAVAIMASSTFLRRLNWVPAVSLSAGAGIAVHLVVALIMGWVSFDTPAAALAWLAMRLVRLGAVLLVLWLISYWHSKREAKQINDKLKLLP